jgi:bifunctional non-homologous end joining protein LigD
VLDAYGRKRDFSKTSEPPSSEPSESEGPLRFVVQKHDARRQHYDLRLECDGVLKSWAVPKGPSLDPKDRRLAVMVEDHPLGYSSFEGVIPKGEYGGGEVIVWDEGIYWPDEDPGLDPADRASAEARIRAGIEKGKLSITFQGVKMGGSWALVKTKGEKDWLLLKHKDAFASTTRDILEDDRSIRSGRTTEDLRQGVGEVGITQERLESLTGSKRAEAPREMKPMLVSEKDRPFTDPQWSFEVKLDGIRVIAIVRQRQVKLLSRSGADVTAKFPSIAEQLAALPYRNFVLDGELVMYDKNGVPSFHALMSRFQHQNPADIRRLDVEQPVELCLFDLIHLDGWDLRGVPFDERRALLEAGQFKTRSVRVLDAFPEVGELLFQQATEMGFEGVIAKRRSGKYQDGTRVQHWLKVKGYQSEEFLIGGFTVGGGMRSKTFGALLLGCPEGDRLRYVGSVGTGFTDRQLQDLRGLLEPDRTDSNPFDGPIDARGSTVWLEPKHWAEVRFMAWTPDRKLRFPVFQRLRLDREAEGQHAAAASGDVETLMRAGTAQGEDPVGVVLAQLEEGRDEILLQVGSWEVKLTSLSKVLWPAHGDVPAVTKRDLVAYFAKVSGWMLPHLRDRPLSLVRLPDGLDGQRFFQKHWDQSLPPFVDRVDIWSSHNDRAGEYILCNNLPTLLWLGQNSVLEIHPWYSRIDPSPDAPGLPSDFSSSEAALSESVLNYPDFIVFDLDPYIYSGREGKGEEPELNRKAFEATVEVAQALKGSLDALKLRAFLKTSGKTGLHVYLPIERSLAFDVVRTVAETFGRHLMKEMPDKITMEWSVAKRPGKVFFDHNQNVRGKTLVSLLSPRPAPGAPVSFPIRWEDLGKVYPADFHVGNVPALLEARGDDWADIHAVKQSLEALLG